MKFSKVNNLKTAASYPKKDNATGFLYKDPERTGKSVLQDINRHVEKQVRTGQRLYRVFNSQNGSKNSPETRFADRFNRNIQIRDMVSSSLSVEGFCHLLKSEYDKYDRKFPREVIDAAVDSLLRKSLYRDSANGIRIALLIGCGHKDLNSITDEEKKEIHKFLTCLRADYQYLTVKQHVAKSIEHQNMLIQPNDKGVFAPSEIFQASSRNRSV